MQNHPEASPLSLQARLVRRLRRRVWVSEVFRPSELQVTLFWAGFAGFLGAVASVAFRQLTQWVQQWFIHTNDTGLVEAFSLLPWWQRLAIPTAGGLAAGILLWFGARIKHRSSTTDYMEAVVLGDGVVSSRMSLVKCASALFSIASGASIGREGPLVQLSTMLASLLGRVRRISPFQLRLLVACGAAAGIASAYNAPIGGALFVSEILLQSIAMESFGPLVFASVIATLTVRELLGANPLYEISIPMVRLNSSWEIVPHALLGLVAGLASPWFLRLLRGSERLFAMSRLPGWLRLALGGLLVGAMAVVHPEVCGNGYSVINSILAGKWVWSSLLFILVLKLLATAATFGSGAVGGVFTPTLFVGACLGYVFQQVAQLVWTGAPLNAQAFVLVGMGAFLAASTRAPIMAIILLFELTLDPQIILPLMIACVLAYYTSMAFEKQGLYSEALRRKGAGSFRQRIAMLTAGDLMKSDPPVLLETARFPDIARGFLTHRLNFLYVVDTARSFKGVVSLHDVKNYLNDPGLADLVIARDILHEDFPCLTPETPLATALAAFAHHIAERMPVLASGADRRLIGSISKSDLILALAESANAELAAGPAEAPTFSHEDTVPARVHPSDRS
jgi:CIC family chloride channel protein